MSKKWKDTTAGGFKVLAVHGPKGTGHELEDGGWAAIVSTIHGPLAINYEEDGTPVRAHANYALVPAEPAVVYETAYVFPGGINYSPMLRGPNLKLTFCKETRDLLTAEVLK